MKRIGILYSNYTPTIDAIKYKLSEFNVESFTDVCCAENYDLIVLLNFDGEYEGEAILCHKSLLPSFAGEYPEMQAYSAGVKVTGVTVYYKNSKKIIAQYPIFIRNDYHFDDLEKELQYLEQSILPVVIEKIAKNEQFELKDILKKDSCSGSCSNKGGCSLCSH